MNQDQRQKSFEAWAVTKGYDLDQVSLLSKPQKFSHYIDPATQKVWEAWQAAIESQEVQALRDTLSNLLPYVVTDVVECRGDKCRELWCASCFPIDEAKREVDKARSVLKRATAALAAMEKQK